LASFSPEGSLINSQTVSGVTRIPFINLLANYSLIDKITIANDTPLSTNNGSFVAAPNWYIWKSSNVNSVGSMALSWDLPLVSGASASAKIVVSGSPNASGVRHFLNCENLGEETCTFSAYYKAPLGQMAVIRVISNTGSVDTKTITATGEVQRESLTFTIPAGATLLYIDSLYTPSYTDTNINTWHVCSPVLNQGSGAISVEKRNKHLERTLTDEFYVKAGYKSEAVVNLFYKQLFGNSVYVSLPESNSVVSSNTTSARLNITTPDNQNKTYEVYSYFSTSETV
jgi:hypothetical protein